MVTALKDSEHAIEQGIEHGIETVGDMKSLDGPGQWAAGVISGLTRSTKVKNLLSGSRLGHPLHPPLTDLPIGAYAMASLLDVTAGDAGAAAARRLVGLGLMTTVPAVVTGANDWSGTHGREQRVGLAHALLNSTATALQAASWLVRRGGRRGTGIALSGLALGFTTAAAYLGGYLSFSRGVGVDHTAFEPTVSDWQDVAAVGDLTEDRPLRTEADGVPVVLVRHKGTTHALSATCTHAGGPLDEGTVVDDALRCPWHGSVFALADGAVQRGPASNAEPRWEVKVENERIHVRSARS